jgi:threonine/homoserine/homoserine lactone efflux protein
VLGLTPGPDMTFFLSRTIARSRAAGFAAFIGASTGLVVHTMLVAAGLSALLAASETAFTILKVAGAAYLAWLAYDAIRNGSALSLERRPPPEALGTIFLKGLLVNLLNPKIIVFFVTFLPQFVSAADPAAARKLIFLGAFFMLINVPLCSAMILSADWIARHLGRSGRAARIIDYVFAGVLGAFAVKLIFTQR